jgi:hypothetical protein
MPRAVFLCGWNPKSIAKFECDAARRAGARKLAQCLLRVEVLLLRLSKKIILLKGRIMKLINSCAAALMALATTLTVQAEPIKIAYSDWPGWVAWQVGIEKGWFKEAGVDVAFEWFEYELRS